MWCATVADVIIHAAASASFLFCRVAHTFHIAVVVVGPYNRDIFRHAQPGIIDIERLLVWYKNLLDVLGFPALVLLQDGALLGKDTLECACPVLRLLTALHGFIVKTAQAHRIDVVVLSRLADAIVQFAKDGFLVGLVVPFAVALLAPFRRSGIVEQQRLTMTGRNHDAPFVGHLLTLRMTVEGSCAGVHGWCEHITLQTKDQFTHLIVGLGTDIAQLLFECL